MTKEFDKNLVIYAQFPFFSTELPSDCVCIIKQTSIIVMRACFVLFVGKKSQKAFFPLRVYGKKPLIEQIAEHISPLFIDIWHVI